MGKIKKKSKGQIKREKEQNSRLAEIKKDQQTNFKEPIKIKDSNISPEKHARPIENIKRKILKNQDVKEWTRDILIHNFSMASLGGGVPLIKSTELRLIHGHRYGLIGKNGAGKSTLLKHIEKKEFDKFPKHLRIHLVEQEMEGTELSVIETVKNADTERMMLLEEKNVLEMDETDENGLRLIEIEDRLAFIEADSAESRASMVLDGLQFTDRMKNLKTRDLSGGWRMRVSIACGLFIEPDVLLLDEPTNHLDFPSICWLTNYLQCYHPDKSLIVVSHEREFLNDITTDIIHIEKSKLIYYKGNFGQFLKIRTEVRRHQATQYERQQREIAHQEDFIRRFKANKKWSTQAQSRMKALAKMKPIEKVVDEQDWCFKFPEPPPLKNSLLIDIEKMAFGYFGEDQSMKTYLLKDVNKRVITGMKVGIIGANGAGKSTLLKLIMKELTPQEGKCFTRNEVVFGYFAQHHMETIDLDATPLEFLRHEFPNTPVQECYSKLGRFHINKKLAEKKVRLLSGGEKSRLAFSILTWYKPQLIIMDEPTNHLDLQTQDALIGALKEFMGSLILVSHDKHLLTSVCNEFWVVGNRTLHVFEDFIKATIFCYKKCIPVDVLPREFSTIETKANKNIPKTSEKTNLPELSGTKIKKKEETHEPFIDCEREITKSLKKNLPPSKILKHIRGWIPEDGNTGPMDVLVYDMFEKYFTDTKFKKVIAIDFFKSYSTLLKIIIPNDHIKNQLNLLKIAQACWFIKKNEQYARAINKNALEEIFESFYQFKNVIPFVFFQWINLVKEKTVGRQEALGLLQNWFRQKDLKFEI